jgi:hypothetical protein
MASAGLLCAHRGMSGGGGPRYARERATGAPRGLGPVPTGPEAVGATGTKKKAPRPPRLGGASGPSVMRAETVPRR